MRRKEAGWPPSEGTSGICGVPFSPWHAMHETSRSASDWANAGAAVNSIVAAAPSIPRRHRTDEPGGREPPGTSSLRIAHAVNCTIEIIRNQKRAVLHDLHVRGTRDVVVVLNESGEERLDRFHRPVQVELCDYDVAPRLLAAVPGPAACDKDGVLVISREHGAGVEAHAERRRMRAKESHRWLIVIARVPPAVLRVPEVALMAKRITE